MLHTRTTWLPRPTCLFEPSVSPAGSHSGHLTKTVVTHVSTHEGPTYYHHSHSYTGGFAGSHAASLAGETVGATSMGESSMGASLMGESVGGSYGAGDAHVMGEGSVTQKRMTCSEQCVKV